LRVLVEPYYRSLLPTYSGEHIAAFPEDGPHWRQWGSSLQVEYMFAMQSTSVALHLQNLEGWSGAERSEAPPRICPFARD